MSHICNLIFFPLNSTVLILKSIPIVEMNVVEKASSEKRNSMHVLPTPESPMSSSLNSRSYVFFAISSPRRTITRRGGGGRKVSAAAEMEEVNREERGGGGGEGSSSRARDDAIGSRRWSGPLR